MVPQEWYRDGETWESVGNTNGKLQRFTGPKSILKAPREALETTKRTSSLRNKNAKFTKSLNIIFDRKSADFSFGVKFSNEPTSFEALILLHRAFPELANSLAYMQAAQLRLITGRLALYRLLPESQVQVAYKCSSRVLIQQLRVRR